MSDPGRLCPDSPVVSYAWVDGSSHTFDPTTPLGVAEFTGFLLIMAVMCTVVLVCLGGRDHGPTKPPK